MKKKVPNYIKETPEQRKERIAKERVEKVVPSKKVYKRDKKTLD